VIGFHDPNCPTLVADLGHIVLSHDSQERERHIKVASTQEGEVEFHLFLCDSLQSQVAAVETDYFYDNYVIQLKEMHAFISPTSSHWYDMEQAEIERRSIINQFDINCNLRVLVVPTEDLPSVSYTMIVLTCSSA
jgi:hypothetical protein